MEYDEIDDDEDEPNAGSDTGLQDGGIYLVDRGADDEFVEFISEGDGEIHRYRVSDP